MRGQQEAASLSLCTGIMSSLEDIISTLHSLEIKSGDTVFVEAEVEPFHDTDLLIQGITQIIGKTGTLVVPANSDIGKIMCDDTTTVTSNNPVAPVVAAGRLADIISEGHDRVEAYARGSSYYKVLQASGKALLIGENAYPVSMIHLAEEIANVPYLDRSIPVRIADSKGHLFTKWVRRYGHCAGYGLIRQRLIDLGALKQALLSDIEISVISLRCFIDAAVEELKTDNESFLCSEPNCDSCAEARAVLLASRHDKEDKEIIELAEEDERTRRMIEEHLDGIVVYFEPDKGETSSN